jgi:hypothetical protein
MTKKISQYSKIASPRSGVSKLLPILYTETSLRVLVCTPQNNLDNAITMSFCEVIQIGYVPNVASFIGGVVEQFDNAGFCHRAALRGRFCVGMGFDPMAYVAFGSLQPPSA